MAREQVEAGSKEEVLTALGAAVASLRERLGESLASVDPVRRAAAAGHDAVARGAARLRAGARRGQQRVDRGERFRICCAPSSSTPTSRWRWRRSPASTPTPTRRRWRRSTRSARSTCAIASASASAIFISWRYYRDAMQDWAKALDLARAWTDAYPRDAFAFNARGLAAELHGLRSEAEAALRKAIELDPSFLPPKGNLGDNLLRQNKLAEAKAHVTPSIAAGIDYQSLYRVGYLAALLQDDAAGMAKYLAGRPQDADVLDIANWDARAAAFRGRLADGHEGVNAARQQALQLELQGVGRSVHDRGRRDSRHRRPLRRGAAPGARGARVEPRHPDARHQRPRPRLVRRRPGARADARAGAALPQRQPAAARLGADRHGRLHGAHGQPVRAPSPARSREAVRGRDDGQAVAGVPARAHLHRAQGPGARRRRVPARDRPPLGVARFAALPDGAARPGARGGGRRRHRGRRAGTTSSCSRCGATPIKIWSRSSRPAARPRGCTDGGAGARRPDVADALAAGAGQLALEPRLGVGPLAFDGAHRDAERLGHFRHGQAAEVAHLDDRRLALRPPRRAW